LATVSSIGNVTSYFCLLYITLKSTFSLVSSVEPLDSSALRSTEI